VALSAIVPDAVRDGRLVAHGIMDDIGRGRLLPAGLEGDGGAASTVAVGDDGSHGPVGVRLSNYMQWLQRHHGGTVDE